jgi:hypothetical protein
MSLLTQESKKLIRDENKLLEIKKGRRSEGRSSPDANYVNCVNVHVSAPA